METTNPRKLRAELKDYLDLANNEPIRINRRSGESFVLMREEHYADLQSEILSLQRRLLAMTQALDGEGEVVTPDYATKRFAKGRKA